MLKMHQRIERYPVLIGVCFIAFASSISLAEPLVRIDPERIEINVLDVGATGIRKFKILNDSPEVVHIEDVTASCGCLSADVDFRQIDPGKHANLTVILSPDSVRRVGAEQVVVSVSGLSEDKLLLAEIQYNVSAIIDIVPERRILTLRNDVAAEPVSFNQTLLYDPSIRVSGLDVLHDKEVLEFIELIQVQPGEAIARFRMLNSAPRGEYQSRIAFRSEEANAMGIFTVSVSAYGPLQSQPPIIFLTENEGSGTLDIVSEFESLQVLSAHQVSAFGEKLNDADVVENAVTYAKNNNLAGGSQWMGFLHIETNEGSLRVPMIESGTLQELSHGR